MYETVDEPINVLASFSGNRVIPHAFVWHRRRYDVTNVHLSHVERHGNDNQYYFAVTDDMHAFQLRFSSASLHWTLHQVSIDG